MSPIPSRKPANPKAAKPAHRVAPEKRTKSQQISPRFLKTLAGFDPQTSGRF
ncbi:MAG: hypothetical protein ABGZ23_11410 [Fuerstiella sp.]